MIGARVTRDAAAVAIGWVLSIAPTAARASSPRPEAGGKMPAIELMSEVAKLDCEVVSACWPRKSEPSCRQAKELAKSQRAIGSRGRVSSSVTRSEWEKCTRAVRQSIAGGCPAKYQRFINAANAEPLCQSYVEFLRSPQSGRR